MKSRCLLLLFTISTFLVQSSVFAQTRLPSKSVLAKEISDAFDQDIHIIEQTRMVGGDVAKYGKERDLWASTIALPVTAAVLYVAYRTGDTKSMFKTIALQESLHEPKTVQTLFDRFSTLKTKGKTEIIEFANSVLKLERTAHNELLFEMTLKFPKLGQAVLRTKYFVNPDQQILRVSEIHQMIVESSINHTKKTLTNWEIKQLMGGLHMLEPKKIAPQTIRNSLYFATLEQAGYLNAQSKQATSNIPKFMPSLFKAAQNLTLKTKVASALVIGAALTISGIFLYDFNTWDNVTYLLMELQQQCGTENATEGCAMRVIQQSKYANQNSLFQISQIIKFLKED